VPIFAAPRAFLEALAHAGVDAVSVANNHAYDQGVAGLAATVQAADALGIATVGAGEDRDAAYAARVVSVRGHRVALIAATEGVNLRPIDGDPVAPHVALLDEAALARSVEAARAHAELVVVMFHWTDAQPRHALPTPEMEAWCARAAEDGADLVAAHGPHVPGPLRTVHTRDGRDVPVLTSLGNLVAAMEAEHHEVEVDHVSVRDAVLAEVRTRVTSEGRLAIASVVPRTFFIGPSSRRLFGDAATRFVRPLSIAAEMQRAVRADCGRECASLREAYARREARLAALFGGSASVSPRTRDTALVATTASASSPSSSPSSSSSPPSSSSSSPSSSSSSSSSLGLRFAPGTARELAHDEEQVRALAARLRDDHRLFVTIIAHPAPGEPRAVAERRAHHARGLVSVLGPSRSRFALEVGAPQDDAAVEIRVAPRE
jgi:poly-gamma-glutamate synthesis protein (capsule biosynthesis protein)